MTGMKSAIQSLAVDIEFMNALQVPVFVKTSEGIYSYCNDAFLRFLGKQRKKVIGCTAYDVAPVALANIYVAADKELFESGKNQTYQTVVQRSDGRTDVVFTKSILRDPSGRIEGFVGTVRCLQDEKKISDAVSTKLTPKQSAVLSLLLRGESVKQIADTLGISYFTVTDHLKLIYRKLGVHSRNEAMFKALSENNRLPFEDNRKWA